MCLAERLESLLIFTLIHLHDRKLFQVDRTLLYLGRKRIVNSLGLFPPIDPHVHPHQKHAGNTGHLSESRFIQFFQTEDLDPCQPGIRSISCFHERPVPRQLRVLVVEIGYALQYFSRALELRGRAFDLLVKFRIEIFVYQVCGKNCTNLIVRVETNCLHYFFLRFLQAAEAAQDAGSPYPPFDQARIDLECLLEACQCILEFIAVRMQHALCNMRFSQIRIECKRPVDSVSRQQLRFLARYTLAKRILAQQDHRDCACRPRRRKRRVCVGCRPEQL